MLPEVSMTIRCIAVYRNAAYRIDCHLRARHRARLQALHFGGQLLIGATSSLSTMLVTAALLRLAANSPATA